MTEYQRNQQIILDLKQQAEYLIEDLKDFSFYHDLESSYVLSSFLDILKSEIGVANLTKPDTPATERQINFIKAIQEVTKHYFDFEYGSKQQATLYISAHIKEYEEKKKLQKMAKKCSFPSKKKSWKPQQKNYNSNQKPQQEKPMNNPPKKPRIEDMTDEEFMAYIRSK